jgi:putative transposase
MKKRKLKKEDLDKMGDLNLDKVLDEISKIDSREGIKTIAALLLNELMKKER